MDDHFTLGLIYPEFIARGVFLPYLPKRRCGDERREGPLFWRLSDLCSVWPCCLLVALRRLPTSQPLLLSHGRWQPLLGKKYCHKPSQEKTNKTGKWPRQESSYCAHTGPEFNPLNPRGKARCGDVTHWELQHGEASKPGLLADPQASERPCLK